ncbi:hypothetical protein PQR65_00765 [Paraburkholderia nemoris]|uniref:hypothetical protein n=1 Tax=Paraburkholderia nemoris TaxID=2793076 RepID=UPI0038BB0DB3
MNAIAPIQFCLSPDAAPDVSAHHDPIAKRFLTVILTIVGASLATAVSFGIATYAGWHRGGSSVERTMNIALASVAVLFAHFLPAGWRALRGGARFYAFALWCVSLAVVLYGQVTFFVVSQRHAGDQRAATIPATVIQPNLKFTGRPLTEIARDTEKIVADLARAEARPCFGDCPALRARRTILTAQIATLKAEASEVKRREAEEDRWNQQVDREAALRATLRTDPVAYQVALWFGMTVSVFDMVLAVANAIVLEGAAIIGWHLMLTASSRVGGREAVALGSEQAVSEHGTVVSRLDRATSDDAVAVDDHHGVSSGQSDLVDEALGSHVMSEDGLLLEQIHKAVVAGHVRPTQAAIRGLLKCGQLKAGRLKREYLALFGGTLDHGGQANAH